MKSYNISLNSIEKVKIFVNIVATYDGDIDLMSDRYVVDAKSIMGIFSLDLAKTLKLNIHEENKATDMAARLKDFMV